jgi:hypothetical protein
MEKNATVIKVVQRFSFVLLLAGSLGAFGWLISIPSEGGMVGGFSVQRLLLLTAAGFSIIASVYVLIRINWDSDSAGGWIGRFASCQKGVEAISFLLSALTVTGFLVLVTPSSDFGRLVYYMERLKPIFLLAVLWSAAGYFTLTIARKGVVLTQKPKLSNLVRKPVLFTYLGLLGLVLFSVLTRWGLKGDLYFWNGPGVPLLLAPVVVAVFLSAWFLRLAGGQAHKNITKLAKLDYVILFGLVVLAAIVWSTTKQPATFFAPGPSAPNGVYYPFSDAAYYDANAIYATLGRGLGNGHYVDKPLYTTLLVFLHAIVGDADYALLTGLQAALLACSVGLVYLISATVHTRASGVLAGLLTMVWGWNMIRGANLISSASPKLQTADFLAAVMLMLIVYPVVRWRKEKGYRLWLAAAAGFTGLAVMVRLNYWLLAPALGFIILVMEWGKWKKILKNVLLAAGVFLLMVVPWEARNLVMIGEVTVFNNFLVRSVQRFTEVPGIQPTSPMDGSVLEGTRSSIRFQWRGHQFFRSFTLQVEQDGLNFGMYQFNAEEICDTSTWLCAAVVEEAWGEGTYRWQVEGVTSFDEISTSPPFSFSVTETQSLEVPFHGISASLVSLLAPRPAVDPISLVDEPVPAVIPIIGNHFFNNLIATSLVFPMSFVNDSLDSLVRSDDSVWAQSSTLHLSLSQWIWLLGHLWLIAVGLASAWRKTGWAGVMPLILFLFYALALAMARTSGGRYIVAINWVVILYWAAGISQVAVWLSGRHKDERQATRKDEISIPTNPTGTQWLALLVSLLVIASAPVWIGWLFPTQLQPIDPRFAHERMAQVLQSADYQYSSDEVGAFLADYQISVMRAGKLLYPRYYPAGEGGGHQDGVYRPLGYNRLVFQVAGIDDYSAAILPITLEDGTEIPQLADVLYIGCRQPNGEDILMAVLIGQDDYSLSMVSNSLHELTCE